MEEHKEKLEFIFKFLQYLPNVLLTSILISLLFIVPYFQYFNLLPELSLDNISFLFVLGLITLILIFILMLPFVFLYFSLQYFDVNNDLNLMKFLKKTILEDKIESLVLIYYIFLLSFFISLAVFNLNINKNFLFFFIILFIFFFVILVSFLISYYYFNKSFRKYNKHYNSTQKEQSNINNLLFSSLLLSGFASWFFTVGEIKSPLQVIGSLIPFLVFLAFLVLIYYIVLYHFVKKKYMPVFFIPLYLFVWIIIKHDVYVDRLFMFFSWFGLASDKNIVLIKKDICNNLPSRICEKLKYPGKKLRNSKNKNYLCSEDIKDYICLEDVKIIWNGGDKIFVFINGDNDSLIIPIPKDYLLNRDFIRKKDNNETD